MSWQLSHYHHTLRGLLDCPHAPTFFQTSPHLIKLFQIFIFLMQYTVLIWNNLPLSVVLNIWNSIFNKLLTYTSPYLEHTIRLILVFHCALYFHWVFHCANNFHSAVLFNPAPATFHSHVRDVPSGTVEWNKLEQNEDFTMAKRGQYRGFVTLYSGDDSSFVCYFLYFNIPLNKNEIHDKLIKIEIGN